MILFSLLIVFDPHPHKYYYIVIMFFFYENCYYDLASCNIFHLHIHPYIFNLTSYSLWKFIFERRDKKKKKLFIYYLLKDETINVTKRIIRDLLVNVDSFFFHYQKKKKTVFFSLFMFFPYLLVLYVFNI